MSLELEAVREERAKIAADIGVAQRRIEEFQEKKRAGKSMPASSSTNYSEMIRHHEGQIRSYRREDAKLEREERRLLDLEADRARPAQIAMEQHDIADRAFWFRRFHTSLALAHGAAFAAIGAHLFDKETDKVATAYAWHPMLAFGIGMIIAGLIPIALYVKRQREAWGLAISSAVLFAGGIGAALWAMWRKADLVLPLIG